MQTRDRMQTLIKILNEASRLYYSDTDNESQLTDAQYDRYLAELLALEDQLGYKLVDSPSTKVGYSESDDKIKHYTPVLSLKSTKSIDELLHFLGEEEGILSWKLDGVSIVLYYNNGVLDRAVSRGDGLYGKDITRNAKMIWNIPKTIENKNPIIVRGEGCITISGFEKLKLTTDGEKYSNPRNLAAGLVNSTRATNELLSYMTFIAHAIIFMLVDQTLFAGELDIPTRFMQFEYLTMLGFEVVPHKKVVNYILKQEIDIMTSEVSKLNLPVDGLVLALNDLEHGRSLGSTSKYPRDIMAFKWPDTSILTKVRGMKWSVSQTGLITPVLLVEPVQLEGTIVKQANLHSLKIFEGLAIGKGDVVEIFKANKIIPEVKENFTRSGTETYPHKCPVCGTPTSVVDTSMTRKLYCYNCEATYS